MFPSRLHHLVGVYISYSPYSMKSAKALSKAMQDMENDKLTELQIAQRIVSYLHDGLNFGNWL